jgi:copper(I)-binding protein
MKMRKLKSGLMIKSVDTVVLKPGASHAMFVDLKNPLKMFKGTLIFAEAGNVDLGYSVKPLGTRAPGDRDPGRHGP